jgi:F-type H+-transporting ATPase subunit b
MRRLRLCFVAALLTLAPAVAQEQPAGKPKTAGHKTAAEIAGENPSEGEHGRLELWKWANFLILVGVLGYMVRKHAGPFFAARSKQIRKEMIEAEHSRKEAEARAADVDRRLANLEAEVGALRREAEGEQQREQERVRRETAAEIAKVQHHAKQEIESAGKAARMELKRYSAELALELAEKKIRSRIDPALQDGLVRSFVSDLNEPASRAQTT